jgi:hypothetical protein
MVEGRLEALTVVEADVPGWGRGASARGWTGGYRGHAMARPKLRERGHGASVEP